MSNKKIAYVDVGASDEILEIQSAPSLPQCGQPVTFSDGDAKGEWFVHEVRQVRGSPIDAYVKMGRKA